MSERTLAFERVQRRAYELGCRDTNALVEPLESYAAIVEREQAAEIARLTALIREQAHTESEYAKALEEENARLTARVAELEQALRMWDENAKPAKEG